MWGWNAWGWKGKGKKGKNPALKDPEKIAKNQQLMDLLLPQVAGIVDSRKGVMKIDEIAAMANIQEMMKDIPQGFSKQLGPILNHYTDFFVNLPYGLVGTAEGYKTGLIKEDGTLDPSAIPQDAKAIPLPPPSPMAPAPPQIEIHAKSPPILPPTSIGIPNPAMTANLTPPQRKLLHDAVNQMWSAGTNLEEDGPLYLAFSNLQAVRSEIKSEIKKGTTMMMGSMASSSSKGQGASYNKGATGKGVKKVITTAKSSGKSTGPRGIHAATLIDGLNLSAEEKQTRKQAIMNRAVEKLQQKNDHTLLLTQIVADDVIKENRKGVVTKFLHFFQEFPNVFHVEHVAGTPQHKIQLRVTGDTTVPLHSNKRQRPY